MKILKAEVINNPIANTAYGKKRVLNCKLLETKEKVACWSNEVDSPIYVNKKPGDIVELIQDNKGKFSLLDRSEETITMSRLSSNGSEGSYYTYNSKENPNRDILEELSLLSNNDKKRLSTYISQQSKLYKHIVKIVSADFPELINVDDRAIRSIAISIFIDSTRKIDNYRSK